MKSSLSILTIFVFSLFFIASSEEESSDGGSAKTDIRTDFSDCGDLTKYLGRNSSMREFIGVESLMNSCIKKWGQPDKVGEGYMSGLPLWELQWDKIKVGGKSGLVISFTTPGGYEISDLRDGDGLVSCSSCKVKFVECP